MHMARREVAVLAEGLQALLQVEDAHQVARGGRTEDGVERGAIARRNVERVAAVSFPDIDDREGRRIVFAPDLARRLGARLVGDLGARGAVHRPAQRALLERQGLLRHAGQRQDARGGLHDPRRNAVVGEAEAFRLLRIDALAGQHQVEGRRRADQRGQAQHAAPAGDDAEHDLGQGEFRTRLVDHDAMAAGEREFQTASHAMAADQCQRRVGHRGEAVEQQPAALDQHARGEHRIQPRELLDVRPGDEAGRLGRGDHQRLGWHGVEHVEHAGELGEYIGGQHVRARLRLVQIQPGQAGVLTAQAPVFPVLLHVRAHNTVSTSIAPPCPPPMQIDARPRPPPLRRSTSSR